MSSPDATWRVYLAEWLIVYTSDADGPEGLDECWDHFERKYKGRVREEDRRVTPDGSGVLLGEWPYLLQLKLPNLKGEFKDRNQAADLLQSMGSAGSLMQRGSAEEQVLLDYGRKMLPDAG